MSDLLTHITKVTIKSGNMVEFQPNLGPAFFYAQFMMVQKVYNAPDGEGVKLRGIPYTRTRRTKGMLPSQRNEIVSILHVDENDDRDWDTQAAVQVGVEDVICLRDFQRTNTKYPDNALNIHDYVTEEHDATHYETMLRASESGKLTNRWKLVTFFEHAADREKGRMSKRNIIRLGAADLEFGDLRLEDRIVLNQWRGAKIPGGSFDPGVAVVSGTLVVDLDSEPGNNARHGPRPLRLKQGQLYTFGDMFCGAGGVTRGAQTAGFKAILAVDKWESAHESYTANFADVDARNIDISDFTQSLSDGEYRVDVLHTSPPCQVWSPAHTVPGANDEANLAALYSTFEVIRKTKPRIVTLEQTFGILYNRFQHYFHLLLNCFTSIDYSVTYKVVSLNTWGVPQPRKRLIIVASCPGESLPEVPGPRPDAATTATVRHWLNRIRPRATHHDVNDCIRRAQTLPNFPKPRYDPNGLLPYTMTCGGGENNHPSGERNFTIREFASLQTFPSNHRFAGAAIRRQIGNAFPPFAVQWLYEHLRRHLLKEDNVAEAEDVVMIID
jgi:DNA (cytosine-5)-methyltransferase 1